MQTKVLNYLSRIGLDIQTDRLMARSVDGQRSWRIFFLSAFSASLSWPVTLVPFLLSPCLHEDMCFVARQVDWETGRKSGQGDTHLIDT